MEAGPDASIRNLVGKGRHVGPTVGHAGCGGAGHRDLGDFRGSEHRLHDTRNGAAEDTMRARILRMHRRIINWLPGRLTVGSRVVVDITVANSSNRPPKVVMVLASNTAISASLSPTATSAMNRALSSTFICFAITRLRAKG